MLNSEVHPLLQDGILTLFIDLNDIHEHCNVHSLGPTLRNMVRTVIEELDTLLRQYFVFQEYQNYLKKKKIEERPTILLKKGFFCQVPENPKTVI